MVSTWLYFHKHPEILSNSPEWTLTYARGKRKQVNKQLLFPNQQITLSRINPDEYKTDVHVMKFTKWVQDQILYYLSDLEDIYAINCED